MLSIGAILIVFQIIEPRINPRVSFIFIPLRNGNFSVSDSDKGILF